MPLGNKKRHDDYSKPCKKWGMIKKQKMKSLVSIGAMGSIIKAANPLKKLLNKPNPILLRKHSLVGSIIKKQVAKVIIKHISDASSELVTGNEVQKESYKEAM